MNKHKPHRLLVQFSIGFLALYVIIFIGMSIIANVLLFNLKHYKSSIENVIFNKSNYIVKIGNIHTVFTYDYLPQIDLNDISISSKKSPDKKLTFKHISLDLSYSSLWKYKIIFNKITITKAKLNIEHTANNEIFLNGLLINEPKVTTSNNKTSSFDIENWLLEQHNINLSNIDISLDDKKNHFQKMNLSDINILYSNNAIYYKSLQITINGIQTKNYIFTHLKWQGGKFEDISKWKYAYFELNSYSDGSLFARRIQQYLPKIGFINQYSAKTSVKATLKKGYLSNLQARVNLSNITYNILGSKNNITFPHIEGNLNINLEKNNTYNIRAENIQISTKDGSVIKNKQISGYYVINKHGELDILNSDLSGINRVLKKIPSLDGVSIAGNIQNAKLIWDGNFLHPDKYNLLLQFKNLGLNSKQNDIVVSNIAGNVNIGSQNGYANINMENGVFIYKKLFYVPYIIKNLNTKFVWQVTSNGAIDVKLESGVIHARDFNVLTSGEYIYTPNTLGYINLHAKLDKIPANRVGFYLPTLIDKANKWLQTSILDGFGENASLILQGQLKDFPYPKNNGKFYIDADVVNGKLRYVPKWPTIDNIYGKFAIRNQKIIIIGDKAKINNNNLTNITVTIPNMLDDDPYLVASGSGNGKTQLFLNYLKQTPINAILGNLPSTTSINGDGKVDIFLKVPLTNPNYTTVNGKYTFINNSIQLNNIPVPYISNTNGELTFNNNGISIDDIYGNILGGTFHLNASTKSYNHSNVINFNLNTHNINYNDLIKLYLPIANPLINGLANTKVSFDVNKNGIDNLYLISNLLGVNILLPSPIGKNASESNVLDFTLKKSLDSQYKMNIAYESKIIGEVDMSNDGWLTYANFGVSSGKPANKHSQLPAVIVINAHPNTFELFSWIDALSKITKSTNQISTTNNAHQHRNTKNIDNSPHSILPIDSYIDTNNFLVHNISFGKTKMEAYTTKNIATFNGTSDNFSGYGTYKIPSHELKMLLYFIKFNFNDYKNDIYNENKTESEIDSQLPYVISSHEFESYVVNNDIQENIFNNMMQHEQNKAFLYSNLILTTLNIPHTTLKINKIYVNGVNIGNVNFTIYAKGGNLVIESMIWNNTTNNQVNIKITNYCTTCAPTQSFVDAKFDAKISDFGAMLSSFNLSNIIVRGSGSIKGHIQSRGYINQFNLKNIAGMVDIDLDNGRFLKADTRTVLGSIIGIINLQTIVNLASLNFKDIFANGFAFNDLEIKAYMINNVFYLKYSYMSSTLAVVGLKGRIDLNQQSINMYLNVTPSLGIGVAVGAGIITLNPIIGVATYLTELALQNPVNKLFSFTYKITGSLKQPKIEQISMSKQVTRNINSTVGR